MRCISHMYASWASLPPPRPSLWVVTEHRAELPVLCSSFPQLSVSPIAMHICQRYSPSSSHPSLPALCPQVHSQHLPLFSCPANCFTSTVFLDSMYMCSYLKKMVKFLSFRIFFQIKTVSRFSLRINWFWLNVLETQVYYRIYLSVY